MKKMTKLMIATAMVSFASLSAAETVSLPSSLIIEQMLMILP